MNGSNSPGRRRAPTLLVAAATVLLLGVSTGAHGVVRTVSLSIGLALLVVAHLTWLVHVSQRGRHE